ncbi:MAG TPA: hypothetical protein VMZ30_16520, partial [Pyrinomonadaceae bacterium]|nr:hypothetical protein [Pyrinomonadaceae bacterium]
KNYNDSAWPEGPALLAAESGATAEPIRTVLERSTEEGTRIMTDYFRTRFNFNGNPAAVRLLLQHVVDDGFVLYLNGVEIYRFGTAAATVVTAQTGFTGHENVLEGPFTVPSGSLVNGENVLAAEVHQDAATSSDIVFGAVLMAAILTDIPPTTVQSISPVTNSVNVSTNAEIQFILTEGTRQIMTNSIRLTINGEAVTPVIIKPAGGISTTISYTRPGGYAPEAQINAVLTFNDSAGNTTTSGTVFRVEATSTPIFTINDTQMWRYSNEGLDLGTTWKEKAFNDSAWPEGPAILALETGATPEPIRTQLVRTDPSGNNIITDYFRTRFTINGDPATNRLQIRHVVDDGVVLYLNGVEVHRFGIAAGATYDSKTFFSGHENAYAGPFEISNASLVQGENVLAAEVHQSDATSSDIVFGLELNRITSTPTTQKPDQPRFTSISVASGNIRVEWSGSGKLQATNALPGGWTDIPNATNPYVAAIAGNARFFRIVR